MTEPFSENGHNGIGHTSTTASSLPDIMSVFQRRKLHLLVGAIVGVVLGIIFYVVSPRRYESTAQILVLKKQDVNPIRTAEQVNTPANQMIQQDFLETHKTVIRSHAVVEKAIQQGNLQNLHSLQGEESQSLVESIIKNLKVERDVDKKAPTSFTTQVLNVSYRGKVPEDCGIIVDYVLQSYRKFLNESSQGSVAEALKLFKQARELVKNDLDKKEADYREFRMNTPVLWKTANNTTLYQERLTNIDAQRAAYMRQQVEIKATLAAAKAAMNSAGPVAALEILSAFSPSTGVVSSRSQNVLRGEKEGPTPPSTDGLPAMSPFRTTLEEEYLHLQLEQSKQMEYYGTNHPQVQSMQERINKIRLLLYPGTADKNAKLDEKDLVLVKRMVEAKVSQFNQQLVDSERSQAALKTLFDTELDDAKKYFPFEMMDDNFKRSLDRSSVLFDSLMKRVDDLDLVSTVGGYESTILTPPLPGEKVWPVAFLILPVGLLLGFIGGFGIAYLAEMADKSFRTPEEIRRSLGVPIIGHIPLLKLDKDVLQRIEAEGGSLLPTICAHYRPKSREAEAYRGVRTALYFSTRGGGYKVLQITSPDMGDGKSTLTANLAVSLAQSGKRVLVVDADLRRPQQGDIFGVTSETGFSSVLMGTAEPLDAIVQTSIPNLSIMPSGSLPPNPAELLSSPRLKEVFDYLSERFDTILVDTPPLLAVTDPSVVSPRVDGVLLTFRLGKESRPHAQRAKEILDTLGAKILGVVVNAIDPRDKTTAYGYGSKYGGYGYGYGYGYYAGNNRYYEENGDSKTEEKSAAPSGNA
jgi:polysaccharide biosynthesis transport protein